MAGFLSAMFVFSKANIWLKILIPYLFLNTFLSAAPHFSMMSFFGVIGCAYFYLLCKRIEDWDAVIKIIFCVLMIQIFLLFLQGIGEDALLNFRQRAIGCYGTVGNAMQFKTLIILCFAFIIAAGKPKIAGRFPLALGVFIAASMICYGAASKAFHYFAYARGAVWLQTFALSAVHPFFGFGVGTYKILFPVMGHGHFQAEGVWMSPHNFWLRILFETGAAGLAIILGYMVSLSGKCRGLTLFAAGLTCFTLAVYFPDCQSSAVPLLILLCAYIEKERPQWKIST
ncbi:MAG: hypothetical protein WC481_08480 [Candidatus Omnitrophota bacterium]